MEMKFVQKKLQLLFLITCVFFTTICFSNLSAGSLFGRAGVMYTTTQNNFRDQQSAIGLVRMTNGFSVVSPASGPQSTYGSSVYMDTSISVSGAIDLRSTNTIILLGDLTLDNGASFTSGGRLYGYDRSVIMKGDLTIPAGNALHIGGRIAINGNGHKLIIGDSAQLFVDTGSTLTLRNLFLQNTKNGPGNPLVQCAATSSQLCFENVILEPMNDFYFNSGQLFIHNDVAFTGTSAFVFRSPQPMNIMSGGKLFFDLNTTFSMAPNTFTDCSYATVPTTTTNNFIKMADQSSQLYLNGCNFYTTSTGCRITKGSLFFDNKVSLKTKAEVDISPLPMSYATSYTSGMSNLDVCSWSLDGRFIAMTGDNGSSKGLEIAYFNGSNSLTYFVSYLTGLTSPSSAAWSPDGKFVALVDYTNNLLDIFSFFNGTLSLVKSISAVGAGSSTSPITVAWSPDGRYLAVSYSGTNPGLQIFAFNGKTAIAGTLVSTSNVLRDISWSPDGKYLCVCRESGYFQIYTFQFPTPTALASTLITTGISPFQTAWSPDGNFIAFVNSSQNTLQIFKFQGSGASNPLASVYSAAIGNTPVTVAWYPNSRYIVVGCYSAYPNNLVQIFSFKGNSNPVLVGSKNLPVSTYIVRSIRISPDGKFISVGCGYPNPYVYIYKINFVSPTTSQGSSNTLSFGNSALGASYDMSVRGLAGSQISVDGLINYDCIS